MQLLSDAEIAEDRADAEDNMTDRCRITRDGDGPKVRNETTGQIEKPPRVVVYEGRCRWQVKADVNSNVVETTAGEREWTYLTSTLQVPVRSLPGDVGDTGNIRPDHIAEALSVPHDPSMVGRLFNIQGSQYKSVASHRRLRLRELVD